MASSLRSRVIHTYRILLKAQSEVFAGDAATLVAGRIKTREAFLKNRELNDEAQISKLLSEAEEMAFLLRRNVVQAVKVNEDTYRLNLDPSRHELRNNEDDWLDKDGKPKKKSWEDPNFSKRRRQQQAAKCS
ncbi:hypothetical protein DFJ74DRAFT_649330 [Hyaloraphidium curvatum]|nr:hypothetical protein DFJ74DRAFT_649330 [Hyaloraphidium curvatum]